MRLTVDKMNEYALELVKELVPECTMSCNDADQSTQTEIEAQRVKIDQLKISSWRR